jgi:hypothetical protein
MQIIFYTAGNKKRGRDDEEKPNRAKMSRRRKNDSDSDSEDTAELADRLAKRMADRKLKTDEVIRPVHHQTRKMETDEVIRSVHHQTPDRRETYVHTPASNSNINGRPIQFSSPSGSSVFASNMSSTSNNYTKVLEAYYRDMDRAEIDRMRAELERERERARVEVERARAEAEQRTWREKLYLASTSAAPYTPGGRPSL